MYLAIDSSRGEPSRQIVTPPVVLAWWLVLGISEVCTFVAGTAVAQQTTSVAANLDRESSTVDSATLDELTAIQSQLRQTLPQILPAIVSVDGGSGVIVNSSGVILTASHVARKAGRTVQVRLSDGRLVTATTLGTNHQSDTGAMKLNSPGPWPFVAITNSSVVQAGDWCISLGYPLSFARGQPAAIRIGRVQKIDSSTLVTDCPIMGGDSGGPLLNLKGHLIGINSRVRNDISENIHIPVQQFLDEWSQLAASIDVFEASSPTGKRAYLGISGETDVDRVRVRAVHRGSPAEKAGFVAEDVLLQLDGKPIGKFNDVLEILETRQPGELVVAKLNRYGRLLSLSVELGQHY